MFTANTVRNFEARLVTSDRLRVEDITDVHSRIRLYHNILRDTNGAEVIIELKGKSVVEASLVLE